MNESPTVVVIGSGPTGAMAAYELVRCNIPVTMLESGSTLPNGVLLRLNGRNVFRYKSDQGFESGPGHEPTGDPQTNWFYNLSPGGLSNQWTGAVPRFAPEDFYEGERLHERYRWPISYEDLVPYYERAERLLDVTAGHERVPALPVAKAAYYRRLPQDWQRVAQYAAARGQGLTVLPLADGPTWMLVKRGTAFNSFTNIIQPLLRSPLFRLITGAHVLQLEWSASQRKVKGVVYHNRADGSQHRLEAAAVMVACGALHSTKLLFDSACADFPDGLGNTSGLLGSYLHDHPREWWAADLDKPISRLAPAAYLTRAPYAESPPLMATSWTIGLASRSDKLLSMTPLKGRSIGVQVFGTMVPQVQHYARPHKQKTDAFGLPILDICIRYAQDVIDNMLQARERLCMLMEDAGYHCRLHNVVPQLTPGTSVHYGGTVRMHSSRQYGLLDAWNRLFDVPNVRVIDASCFTTNSEKNPTLTAMAIAARAAHHCAHELKHH